MKRKLFLIVALCLCAGMITGCGKSSSGSEADTGSSQAENTNSAAEPQKESIPFEKTIGVWTYSDDIVFHSSDGKRYALTEDTAGTVQAQDGTSYAVQDCDYKLITIVNVSDTTLNVKEGRFSEAYVGSKDYPDGYKTMMIAYQKSDLFDLDQLEEAVKGGGTPVTQEETTAETVSGTEEVTAEPETETETETTVPETTEETTETQASETSAETESESEAGNTEAEAEYAAIYKKLEDFLETDNYKQKDPGNRSLEVFNYLHNLADSNIEESSITNDTAKNEVSFKCYEKYLITINNAEATITVTEE